MKVSMFKTFIDCECFNVPAVDAMQLLEWDNSWPERHNTKAAATHCTSEEWKEFCCKEFYKRHLMQLGKQEYEM